MQELTRSLKSKIGFSSHREQVRKAVTALFMDLNVSFETASQAKKSLSKLSTRKLQQLNNNLDKAIQGTQDANNAIQQLLVPDSPFERVLFGHIEDNTKAQIRPIIDQLLRLNIPLKNALEARDALADLGVTELMKLNGELSNMNNDFDLRTRLDPFAIRNLALLGNIEAAKAREIFPIMNGLMKLGLPVRTAFEAKDTLAELEVNRLRDLQGMIDNFSNNLTGELDPVLLEEVLSMDNPIGRLLLTTDTEFLRVMLEIEGAAEAGNIDQLKGLVRQLEKVDRNKAVRLDNYLRFNRGDEVGLSEIISLLNDTNSLKDDGLKEIINRLPNTEESLNTIERIEANLIQNGTDETGLSIYLHQTFFIKKTEILENLVEQDVINSRNFRVTPLNNLGRENYWKMLIDRQVHQNDNKHFYDISRGFMGSMMKGLKLNIENLGEPLTMDFLSQLHDTATSFVTYDEFNDNMELHPTLILRPEHFQQTGIKNVSNSWGVHPTETTEEGVRELEALMREQTQAMVQTGTLTEFQRGLIQENPNSPIYYSALTDRSQPFTAFRWSTALRNLEPNIQEATANLMEFVIQKYNAAIEEARSEDEKLEAIIDCCRGMGVIHPFIDANGRTFMILLLNKLLMDNGMDPTVLQDQGLMIGLPKRDLIRLIKEGQEYLRGV
ncbi:MAG: Fic family protein [Bacteroidetes bacterium]|nr:Fic family protein [Bacteroidota bacterium]